jgi:hypothetical protein
VPAGRVPTSVPVSANLCVSACVVAFAQPWLRGGLCAQSWVLSSQELGTCISRVQVHLNDRGQGGTEGDTGPSDSHPGRCVLSSDPKTAMDPRGGIL